MASDHQISQVDQKPADGGRKHMLEVSKVHREIVKILGDTEDVGTLAEFGAYFTKSKYKEEAATLRDKVAAVKVRQVEVSCIGAAALPVKRRLRPNLKKAGSFT